MDYCNIIGILANKAWGLHKKSRGYPKASGSF